MTDINNKTAESVETHKAPLAIYLRRRSKSFTLLWMNKWYTNNSGRKSFYIL